MKMSKKKIFLTILLIIVIIVIIAGIATFVVQKKLSDDKDYTIEQIDKYNYFVLKTNNKYGVIDNKGNIIVDAEYDKVIIPNPTKDVFVCYKTENAIILNSNKESILAEYDKVEPIKLKNVASDLMYEKSVLKYEANGKYGIISFKGKPLTKAIYDSIDSVSYKEGELLVKKDEKYGIINIKGREIVKTLYDNIISDEYSNEENGYKSAGYIVGNKLDDGFKYGYINSKGKMELDIEYNEINRVNEIQDKDTIFLIARKNGQYGLLKNGKEVLGYEYQAIEYDENSNIFVLEKTKKFGIANSEGKLVLPVEYTDLELKGKYIYVKKDENKYVYDKDGNSVNIDYNKSILDTTNDNYKITITVINDKNLYGVIDANNKQIIEEKYSYIEYAYDNYFIACGDDGKLGIIDSNSNVVVSLSNDVVEKVQGKDVIQISNLLTNTTSIYSSKMKQVIELTNANIQNEKDYIKVYNEKGLKYLDKEGNIIEASEIFENKLFTVEQNGKWGFKDKVGDVKIEPQYQKVTDFNKYGYAGIKKNDKWGVINENGEIILEPSYEFKVGQEPDFVGKYYKVQYEFGEMYYTDEAVK